MDIRTLCDKLEDHIISNAHHYARDVCTALADLLERKRADYGPPERTIGEWGMLGIAVRLGDKYARLKHMVQENHKPNFESLEDTLLDIAGYGVLGLALAKDERTVRVCVAPGVCDLRTTNRPLSDEEVRENYARSIRPVERR